ncbi:MAG: hypothetical protein KF718_33205 [Polyangiaceae bacterium]|nr:hypothetical protein [Polyangiaceae bacterium]
MSLLRRKERRTQTEIVIRLSDAPNAACVTTIPLLRQHCPELFDTREEALEIVREYVDDLRDAVAELKLRDRALASRIKVNTEAIRRLTSAPRAAQSERG